MHFSAAMLKVKVLTDIISLYFKVKIHQKGECAMDKISSTKHDAKKEANLLDKLRLHFM